MWPPLLRLATVLILFGCLFHLSSAELVLKAPSGNETLSLDAVQVWYAGNWNEIQNHSTVAHFYHPALDIQNKAIILTFAIFPDTNKLVDYSRNGAAIIYAVFVGNKTRLTDVVTQMGRQMYRFQSLSDLPEITTPVILFRLPDEESETAMFNFGNATGEVEVTYINNQPNEWKAFTETVGSHVMQWVVFVLHVLVISLVTFRLYGFISDFGLQWSLPQISLTLELINLFIKLLWLIDPAFTRLMFNIYAGNILVTLAYPFFFSIAILLIFYWMELTTDAVISAKSSFLTVYRIPAFVVLSLLFVVELVSNILRVIHHVELIGVYLSGAYYALVMVLLSISYFTATTLVYRRMGKGSTFLQRKLVILMTAMAIGYACVFTLAIFQITTLRNNATGYYYILLTTALITCLLSLIQTISFEPPSQKFHSTSADRGTTSKERFQALGGTKGSLTTNSSSAAVV